ncbi:MAG: M1 family metallopeptidase [Bacteroidia bacterium]
MYKCRKIAILLTFVITQLCFCVYSNKPVTSGSGGLSNLFSSVFYDITVKVLPDEKKIIGSNKIWLKLQKPLKNIEIDLFNELQVDSVLNELNEKLEFKRLNKKVQIIISKNYQKNDSIAINIYYNGKPVIAKNAPWDGGFVWSKDSLNNHWVGLACQGLGASCWLPCFDRWDLEPKVKISIITPKDYMGVSNGHLIKKEDLNNDFSKYTWQVLSPINVYNISINVAKYTHINDEFFYDDGTKLTLDYYVLKYNTEKAKTHFQQVKRMMQCFEKIVGKYPFINDGYKLVETPYWGMEHQSCVAYGNNYKYNNFGFDLIIIHESAHEWFGNSLTAEDPAHFWLHESFTTYMENIFVECLFGKKRGAEYILEQKKMIKNNFPMVGISGTGWRASDNDVYYKGAMVLHTLRQIVDNDNLWRETLKKYTQTYKHHTINTNQTVDFFSKELKRDLKHFFDAYLNYGSIPVLQYFIENKEGVTVLHYKLKSYNKLKILIRAKISKIGYDFIEATPAWQVLDIPFENFNEFEIDPNFLVDIEKLSKRNKMNLFSF